MKQEILKQLRLLNRLDSVKVLPKSWFIDNDDHLFSYDSETHNITEKITSLVQKTYTFEEFNDIAAACGWMGKFKPYEF